MRVGDAARQVGTSARMLRYAEQLGLVAPARTAGGYRDYRERDLLAAAAALQLQARYRVTPAALAFGLRALDDPEVASSLRQLAGLARGGGVRGTLRVPRSIDPVRRRPRLRDRQGQAPAPPGLLNRKRCPAGHAAQATRTWPPRACARSTSRPAACRCCRPSRRAGPRPGPWPATGSRPACTSPPRRPTSAAPWVAGGAELALCASNPLSTKDDVAAAIHQELGAAVFAVHGADRDTFYRQVAGVLASRPTLVVDDGADLTATSTPAAATCWRHRRCHRGDLDRRAPGRNMAREGALPTRCWPSTTPPPSTCSTTATAPASRPWTASCGPPTSCSPARCWWWSATAGAGGGWPRGPGASEPGWRSRSTRSRPSRR